MRTYAKDYANHPRTVPYTKRKMLAERLAKEWDIRIDVDLFISPHDIKRSLELDLDGLDYALIGVSKHQTS